jgi:hypothetical protein
LKRIESRACYGVVIHSWEMCALSFRLRGLA